MTALAVSGPSLSIPMVWIPNPVEDVPSYFLAYIENERLISIPFEEPDGPHSLGEYVSIPIFHKKKEVGVFIVSPHREEWAKQWVWRAYVCNSDGFYGPTRPGRVYVRRNEAGRTIYIHREIIGARFHGIYQYGDHLNRHTLDNRDKNINPRSARGNGLNRGVRL